MKFKIIESDEGLKFIEIKVPFSIGPMTMAKFLKLMEFSYPYKEPGKWKIRGLLWSLKHEIMYNGRKRIDDIEVKTEEEDLYYGAVEKYFPELKR
jgi:hypothetical protein